MQKYLIALFFVVAFLPSFSQELDCRIQINHQSLQGTTYEKVFQTMQRQLYEFINNTNWTNNVFARNERIECNLFITVSQAISSDEFKGKIQVTSSRPTYGASYLTPVFNYLDNDFQFKYVEEQPFEFNPNISNENLISVLAYYCYIIIGMDYDTFAPNAGSPYFQIAEKIVQNSQTAAEPGWKAYENLKNRYWLVENLLNNQYSGFRDFNYQYHRVGMDRMSDKPNEARSAIESALESIRNVHRRKPGSFLMAIYTSTKCDEIINIFSEGFSDEKSRVFNIMKEIDPANSSKYERIMKEPEP